MKRVTHSVMDTGEVMEGELNVKIDLEKFNQDAQRDGLKRYITNVSLTKEEILEN